MRGAYRWIAGHPSTSIIVFFAILPFIVPYKALATQLLASTEHWQVPDLPLYPAFR